LAEVVRIVQVNSSSPLSAGSRQVDQSPARASGLKSREVM
jgi:hypothetical protein